MSLDTGRLIIIKLLTIIGLSVTLGFTLGFVARSSDSGFSLETPFGKLGIVNTTSCQLPTASPTPTVTQPAIPSTTSPTPTVTQPAIPSTTSPTPTATSSPTPVTSQSPKPLTAPTTQKTP